MDKYELINLADYNHTRLPEASFEKIKQMLGL